MYVSATGANSEMSSQTAGGLNQTIAGKETERWCVVSFNSDLRGYATKKKKSNKGLVNMAVF